MLNVHTVMVHDHIIKYYTIRSKKIKQNFEMACDYCDPKSIHDLRVEIKRLRALFRLLQWIAPDFRAKKNIRPLRRLFKVAADIRDIHVQQELTRKWTSSLQADLSAYYNELKHRELPARQHFQVFAIDFQLRKALNANEERIARTFAPLTGGYAQSKVRQRVNDLLAQLLQHVDEHGQHEPHLHKIRILTKETRYTIEIAKECNLKPDEHAMLIQLLRRVHQSLGKWHDADIALEHLDDFCANYFDGSPSVVYRDLITHIHQEKNTLLQQFEQCWNELTRYLADNPLG